MNRTKQLEENYANAVFALLMDAVGRSENERIEREFQALEADTEFAVPESFDQRCKKTIGQYFAFKGRHRTGRTVRKVFVRIAVAVLICALLFSTALAVSPTLRKNILNLMVEVYEESTDYRLEVTDDDTSELTGFTSINLWWMPEDYMLTVENWLSDTFVSLTYENENAEQFRVAVSGGSSLISLDTEDATLEATTIQGCDATIIEKTYEIDNIVETSHQITWYDTSQNCMFVVASDDLDLDTLIQIAESIQVER